MIVYTSPIFEALKKITGQTHWHCDKTPGGRIAYSIASSDLTFEGHPLTQEPLERQKAALSKIEEDLKTAFPGVRIYAENNRVIILQTPSNKRLIEDSEAFKAYQATRPAIPFP